MKIDIRGNINETLRKSVTFMLLRVMSFILAYGFAYFVIQGYGEDTYGYVMLSFTVMIIASVFTVMGFDINLTKVFAEEESINNHVGKYYSSLLSILILSTLLGTVIFIFSDAIAIGIFKKPGFAPFLRWTAIAIPFWSLIKTTSAVYRGLKNIFLFSIFNSFGRFFLALIVLYVGYSFIKNLNELNEFPVIAHLIGLCILFLLAIGILVPKLKKIEFSPKTEFKVYFKDSLAIMVSASLIIVLAWADKFFIGVYLPEAYVGIYDIAFRVSALIVFSLEAINSILTPKISTAFHKGNLNEMQREIDHVSKLNLLVSAFIFIVIIILNKFIFMFFGTRFLEGQAVLFILCGAQLINSYTGPVWNIMQMTGYQRALSKILIVSVVLNIIGNIIFIKYMGIEGAALATGISLCYWNIVAARYIYKKIGIRSFYLPKAIQNFRK